jgi:type III pantothenate kinase
MLLAIDVGNSHTVCGIFQGQTCRYHWRFKTDRRKTADDLAGAFYTMLTMKDLQFKDIESVVIASVVPTQQKAWLQFVRETGWKVLEIDRQVIASCMNVRLDHPEEVGADRIVNAVAAYSQYGTALIIIDFGTAITFDCVSREGEYLGGAIAPGIAISLDALAARTAKLPRVDLSAPLSSPIGTNTNDAMKSGILYGYGGLVNGLVKELKKFFPVAPKVIATGGMADLIIPFTDCIDSHDSMLTLTGLRIFHERQL